MSKRRDTRVDEPPKIVEFIVNKPLRRRRVASQRFELILFGDYCTVITANVPGSIPNTVTAAPEWFTTLTAVA